MSNKMTCPACNAHLSSVRMAFETGEPCPECGLSATAAIEVLGVQSKRGDESLKQQLADALIRAGRAEAEATKLREKLARIRWAVEDEADG